jgi:hypothetical protein
LSIARYPRAHLPRTERLASAAEHAVPEKVALRMLRRLLETTTQREGFDPFAHDA